jgi:hypothetical protein
LRTQPAGIDLTLVGMEQKRFAFEPEEFIWPLVSILELIVGVEDFERIEVFKLDNFEQCHPSTGRPCSFGCIDRRLTYLNNYLFKNKSNVQYFKKIGINSYHK